MTVYNNNNIIISYTQIFAAGNVQLFTDRTFNTADKTKQSQLQGSYTVSYSYIIKLL